MRSTRESIADQIGRQIVGSHDGLPRRRVLDQLVQQRDLPSLLRQVGEWRMRRDPE
jgi:hypothetical protein